MRARCEYLSRGQHLYVYDLAGASDRRGSDEEREEEQRGQKRRRPRESKTVVAVYGEGFYGITHRRRKATALLLSILAMEIGCLLIDICLSRDNLNDTRVNRVEDAAAIHFRRFLYENIHGISARAIFLL